MKLETLDLHRHFGAVRAVDGISFSLESGQIYGFVGPNGAGKTTTMRILATLDEPTSGDARIDGLSLVQEPEIAHRCLGFMPDHLPSHQDINVFEYLDFFARAYGLKGPARRQVLDTVLEFTGMGEIRDKLIHSLSKGMKQRVSLARAMIHDPGILVLDEPAAGLDPRARVELRELLLALAAEGKAVLISSHILTELSEICDGAVIIEHGRIVRAGLIDDLLSVSGPLKIFRLRCLGPLEALHRFLLTSPHVEEVRSVGQEIEIDLSGDDEAAGELLAYLVENDQRIVEFRRQRSGLEDVFMQVTQGDLR